MRSITGFALSLLTGARARDAAIKAAQAAVAANPEQPGAPGKSAYQLWVDAGHSGSEAQFLSSLQGQPGSYSTVPGPSAYDVWIAAGGIGTRAEFLASLKGPKGDSGTFGPTAIGVVATPALALLATLDVVMTLSRPMPDTGYTVDMSMTPSGLQLAGATVVKSKTTTTVTLTIKAAVALGAGSIVALARY